MEINVAERLRAVLPKRRDYTRETIKRAVRHPIAITSDVHLPYVDEYLFERFYDDCKEYGCKEAWIIGDLFNQDAYSRFAAGLNDSVASFKDELEVARHFLDLLFEVVEKVYVTRGNHDIRVCKANNFRFGLPELYRMIYPRGGLYPGGKGAFIGDDGNPRELVVSDLPSIRAYIGKQEWFFCHPGNYSKVPGKVARDFAAKLHCNVAVGHTHAFSMSKDVSGKYWTIDLGGLFKKEYFDYLAEEPKTLPEWSAGYFLFDGEGNIIPRAG